MCVCVGGGGGDGRSVTWYLFCSFLGDLIVTRIRTTAKEGEESNEYFSVQPLGELFCYIKYHYFCACFWLNVHCYCQDPILSLDVQWTLKPGSHSCDVISTSTSTSTNAKHKPYPARDMPRVCACACAYPVWTMQALVVKNRFYDTRLVKVGEKTG